MVERLLRALPGVPGFLATVACAACRAVRPTSPIRRLDSSIGEPEPHGLTARIDAARLRDRPVHRIQPRVRDDRDTPLGGVDGAKMPLLISRRKRNIFAPGTGHCVAR